MTQAIWKYQLLETEVQQIQMPAGTVILAAQNQYGTPFIWALVHTDRPTVTRKIIMVGTGQPFDTFNDWSKQYVDTLQMYGGRIVLHVFDGGEL